jgi:hypothetical protein
VLARGSIREANANEAISNEAAYVLARGSIREANGAFALFTAVALFAEQRTSHSLLNNAAFLHNACNIRKDAAHFVKQCSNFCTVHAILTGDFKSGHAKLWAGPLGPFYKSQIPCHK